jgi:hypothetical protein
MEFKQDNTWPVSGFNEPQDLGVHFYSGGDDETFDIQMEGDIVVDDGWLHYGVHTVALTEDQAKQLRDELATWLGKRVWGKYDHEALAKNFEKIDKHDGSPGRGVNSQDGST